MIPWFSVIVYKHVMKNLLLSELISVKQIVEVGQL
jgi:hypothetical protein